MFFTAGWPVEGSVTFSHAPIRYLFHMKSSQFSRFAGPCSAATILICSSGMPKPKCSPFSEFLILFRKLPFAIGIMSYTCLTRAGFFASWLNSLQSDLVYTSCASVGVPAVPTVASATTLVAAVLTNDLRFILFIPPFRIRLPTTSRTRVAHPHLISVSPAFLLLVWRRMSMFYRVSSNSCDLFHSAKDG